MLLKGMEVWTLLTRLRPQVVSVVPLLQPRLTAALQHIQTSSAVVNAWELPGS